MWMTWIIVLNWKRNDNEPSSMCWSSHSSTHLSIHHLIIVFVCLQESYYFDYTHTHITGITCLLSLCIVLDSDFLLEDMWTFISPFSLWLYRQVHSGPSSHAALAPFVTILIHFITYTCIHSRKEITQGDNLVLHGHQKCNQKDVDSEESF